MAYVRHATAGDSDDRIIANALSVFYKVMAWAGGVAILIDAFTDNRNRTNQELKFLLSEMGYAVASPGSASWAFARTPEGEWHATTTVPISDEDAEKLATLIEKLESHEDVENVTTNAD